ncbi:siderophore-interacting protein [Auraticoccus monumenti]|uniref:NADPH-dependent ferric siderophore reductase, contains FAD-binding and SIP domains n=1 Tax=Auraticoccus monumenti TaxID=675864 RepID=A0A1G6XCD2_9ACTN|nr:siderophore-interacting protein [Auraticoccus monumenti]SDD75869.1 NADPH-dependent ferric siderophore reductase, contains FAD-binding and SIP domains [Auraticoccus monumenti]
MSTRRAKPPHQGLVQAEVARRELVSPGFVRVTLQGPQLSLVRPLGHDHWVRFFLPRGEGSLDRLPASMGLVSYARYRAIPAAHRPVLRNYTVAAVRHDGSTSELDLEFVLHEPGADGEVGPAAGWAAACVAGDRAALIDEGTTFLAPEDTGAYLLVGDDTALPAVAGILRSLPAAARGLALVEVGHPEDVRELEGPPEVEVRWVVRSDPQAVPGAQALERVRELPRPAPDTYAWVAGESALATGARRHLVQECGLPKERVTFVGYWRHGRAQY